MNRSFPHRFFGPIIRPLPVWAMRDLLRRPGETLFLAATLSLIVVAAATVLLLTQALATTADRLLSEAPSLVVRKVGPGGWQPLPAGPAVAAARTVPGVTGVRPRIWGVVNGPDRPVTVVGIGPNRCRSASAAFLQRLPARGEAVVGSGLARQPQAHLRLLGTIPMDFTVIDTASPQVDIAAHDVVLLHPDDARQLLGLPAGYASDLAVDVFHEEEETAILPELSAAFDGPVRITTRGQASGYYAAALSRTGGLSFLAIGAALFSVLLIIWFITRERTGRKHEVGLLKSLGWTTGDIVSVQLYRALLVGLPAAALGSLIAWGLVFWPGLQWPAYLLFGWETSAPALYLDADGAVCVLLEVTALVLVPFVAAALLPALRHAAAAPLDLIDEGHW